MSRSPWEPTWRRLAATTAVLFTIILAFLAGRVRAGADPGLRSSAAQTPTQTQTQTPSQTESQPQQPDLGVPEDSDPPSTHVS